MAALETSFLEKFLEVLHPVLIGATGGVVALILKNARPPLSAYIAAIVVSGFTGFLVFNMCRAYAMNDYLTSAAVGIGGVFGPLTLNAMGKLLFDKLGLDFSLNGQNWSGKDCPKKCDLPAQAEVAQNPSATQQPDVAKNSENN